MVRMLDRLRKLLAPAAPEPDWNRPWALVEAERQGEQAVRQRLARGDLRAWQELSALLFDQGRSTDLDLARAELAAAATPEQLRELVHQAYRLLENERADAAVFQRALVTRFPAGPEELERSAAKSADAGRLDDAVADLREAIRLGNPRPWFFQHPMWTIKELTAAGRYDDAEELLRGYPDDHYAVSALALLLQVRGRAAEGDELLQRHPAAEHEILRLTRHTLLDRDGRPDEAAALRPEHGWTHQRSGRITGTPGPAAGPHQAIWSVVDDWGRGMAV